MGTVGYTIEKKNAFLEAIGKGDEKHAYTYVVIFKSRYDQEPEYIEGRLGSETHVDNAILNLKFYTSRGYVIDKCVTSEYDKDTQSVDNWEDHWRFKDMYNKEDDVSEDKLIAVTRKVSVALETKRDIYRGFVYIQTFEDVSSHDVTEMAEDFIIKDMEENKFVRIFDEFAEGGRTAVLSSKIVAFHVSY